MRPIRENLSTKLNHRVGLYRVAPTTGVSKGILSDAGQKQKSFSVSDSISFCHQLAFGSSIDHPEDLKYWSNILSKYNGDFLALLSEMRRSRKTSSEDLFSDLFSGINIDYAAQFRPGALVVSLFIHASGRFPTIDDVVDVLSVCSVQQLRIRDVVGLVAERTGTDSKKLKTAIGPHLSSNQGALGRLKLHLLTLNTIVRNSEVLTDLILINLLVQKDSLSHDVGQMQSILVSLARLVSTAGRSR